MSESHATGYFEVTGDAARFCRAAFLARIGQRTPARVRFWSPGVVRRPRGFTVRLSTEQGEHAIETTNVPVASTRSGEPAPRRSVPGLEAAHQLALLMSERGAPRSWRHMNGYAPRRFMWINGAGELSWVRYHFKTEQGVETVAEPAAAGREPADLTAALRRGESPAWRFDVQVMPHGEVARAGFDPFDQTKVWPHADYPPRSLGRLVLEREASAPRRVPPSARVLPGVGPAPSGMAGRRRADDDCLQVRRFWCDVLTEAGRDHLVANLAHGHPGSAHYWAAVDPEIGVRVAIAAGTRARVS
jgi:catalase